MRNFIKLVEQVLDKKILLEMPIGTLNKSVWVDSIVRKLVYNRPDTPLSIKTAREALSTSTKEASHHKGDRYCFDVVASQIIRKIFLSLNTLGLKNTKQDILSNLDSILEKLDFDQDITEQVKQNIVLGLETEEKINFNFFIDIVVRQVCEFLFDKIFEENEELQGFSPYDDDSKPQTPEYLGFPDSREEYDNAVQTYLPQAFKFLAQKIKLPFNTTANNLKYTVRLIVLSDSETLRSFPLQYTGMARGTKDTGLDLKQRVAIAGETSNKGIKSNIIEVDKFNNAAFTFTGSTEGLSERERNALENLLSVLSSNQNVTGSELKKVNRSEGILPDNKSLFSFLNKLTDLGLVTRKDGVSTQSSDWSKGGNKPKNNDDDFISSLF